jgi:hypothetical protein
MYLASGANLSRSEHHSFLSMLTNVAPMSYRRTRESVCHYHGLAVGTWATVADRGRLSNLFLPKRPYFFPFF